MNGTSGNNTDGDGALGFRPGHYGGTFLGGKGNDTLVFEHFDPGDNAQMYVGLDSGFAMFGNGASSPLSNLQILRSASRLGALGKRAIATILLLSAEASRAQMQARRL